MKEIFPPTVVLRHRKENLKKCSLTGLEIREDFRFYTYPKEPLPELTNYILLDLEAPPLTEADSKFGLFILDATWKYAEKMAGQLKGEFIRRSIPSHFRTAYPRKQDDCQDPTRGLASIEAIYIAYTILGRETKGLLDHYYWREAFLEVNEW